jgi:glyoxylase-like metal-dependent hydrolase (beta-lactamase superfamily II)
VSDTTPVEVAPGVHRLGSRLVNWYAVTDGSDVTLVDTGFPGHWRYLAPGLAALGRRIEDVRAVVVTHSHVDHTGFAARLVEDHDVPVMVHAADAIDGARRFPPMHLYLRPSSWGLLAEGLRDGMPTTRRIPRTHPVVDGDLLDAPGRPRAVHLGGHTPGSTAFVLADRGVVFTGDNLVTLDPYTRREGPQLMVCGVQHDEPTAAAAMDRLAREDVPTLLPGHGDPWNDGVALATERALEVHRSVHGRSLAPSHSR